jgi:hypothetical protein
MLTEIKMVSNHILQHFTRTEAIDPSSLTTWAKLESIIHLSSIYHEIAFILKVKDRRRRPEWGVNGSLIKFFSRIGLCPKIKTLGNLCSRR